MARLEPLLNRLKRKRRARLWYGSTPPERASRIPSFIAAKLGYPAQVHAALFEGELQSIDRLEAARTLAWVAKESLAYSKAKAPSASLVKDVMEAFADLAPEATFYTNGNWAECLGGHGTQWTPLSDATFDTGVIGFDSQAAFIFWVEDED